MSKLSNAQKVATVYVLGRVAGAKAKHEYRMELGASTYKNRLVQRDLKKWAKGNSDICVFCSDEHREEAWKSFAPGVNHTEHTMCPYHTAKFERDYSATVAPTIVLKNLETATKWMVEILAYADELNKPKEVRVIKAPVS